MDGRKQKTRESLGFTRVLLITLDYLVQLNGGGGGNRTRVTYIQSIQQDSRTIKPMWHTEVAHLSVYSIPHYP